MDQAPALRVAFFLELPFDIGLPHGYSQLLVDSDKPLPGYEDAVIEPWAHWNPPPVEGLPPLTSFLIGKAWHRGEPFLATTYRAFGGAIEGGRTRARFRFWKSRFRAPYGIRGRTMRAVVKIVRIVPHPEDPDGDRWVFDQFSAALSKLNELLLAIAVVSGDPHVRPVSARDLPAAIPYHFADLEATARPWSCMLLLHSNLQIVANLLTPAEIEHVTNLGRSCCFRGWGE